MDLAASTDRMGIHRTFIGVALPKVEDNFMVEDVVLINISVGFLVEDVEEAGQTSDVRLVEATDVGMLVWTRTDDRTVAPSIVTMALRTTRDT